jgi:hypothetical protein
VIVWLVLQLSMILSLAFQQAMMVGLNLSYDIILGLVLTTNYDYIYGLSAGHDCRTGFSATCDISFHAPVYIHNNFPLVGYNCVIK